MIERLRKNIGFAVGVGVFVASFLLLFRPFGLQWNNWQDPTLWYTIGLAPFNAALILVLDVCMEWVKKRSGMLDNRFIYLLATMTIIILCNVGYQAFIWPMSWDEVFAAMWHVALVAFFPTLFVVLYVWRNQNQQSQSLPPTALTLRDENNRETLTLPTEELLFITSDRNYALIHTTTSSKPFLLRSSLKRLEQQLDGSAVVRCHRSYLVNTYKIMQRQRHARGMHLTLRDVPKGGVGSVPVSPTFLDTFASNGEG